MSLDNVEDSLKVIVVGDGNVGKTSMLRRFVKGEFLDQYKKTIGAEFMEKDLYIAELHHTIKLMLWDTAGQEVFNALTASYYRGAGAAILAFSTIDRDSFFSVEKWKDKVEAQCGAITMVLCQTKMDLAAESAVSPAEAEALATKLKLPLFRVSTKDNLNVTQLFEFAAQRSIGAGASLDGGVHNIEPTRNTANAARPADSSQQQTVTQQNDIRNQQTDSGNSPAVAPPAPQTANANSKPVQLGKPKEKKDKKEKKGFFSNC